MPALGGLPSLQALIRMSDAPSSAVQWSETKWPEQKRAAKQRGDLELL